MRTTIDTHQLAHLVDLTATRIRQLTSEGVLRRALGPDGRELRGRYELVDSVLRYIRFLRGRVMGFNDGETEYRRHRTSLMGTQAERARLELEAFKSTLHRLEDVQAVFHALYRHIRARARECVERSARRISENPKPQDFGTLNAILTAGIESCLSDISVCGSARDTDPELLAYIAALKLADWAEMELTYVPGLTRVDPEVGQSLLLRGTRYSIPPFPIRHTGMPKPVGAARV